MITGHETCRRVCPVEDPLAVTMPRCDLGVRRGTINGQGMITGQGTITGHGTASRQRLNLRAPRQLLLVAEHEPFLRSGQCVLRCHVLCPLEVSFCIVALRIAVMATGRWSVTAEVASMSTFACARHPDRSSA